MTTDVSLHPEKSGVANTDVDWFSRGKFQERFRRRASSVTEADKYKVPRDKGCMSFFHCPVLEDESSRSVESKVGDGDSEETKDSRATQGAKDKGEPTAAKEFEVAERKEGARGSKQTTTEDEPVSEPMHDKSDKRVEQNDKDKTDKVSDKTETRKKKWFQLKRPDVRPKAPIFAVDTLSYTPAIDIPDPRCASPRLNMDPITTDVLCNQNPFDGSLTTVSSSSFELPSPKSPAASTGSLMHRLRRLSKSSAVGAGEELASASSVSLPSPASTPVRMVFNKCPVDREANLPQSLKGALPRRVMFGPQLFERDPPQQIPSKKPRMGNIQLSATGDAIEGVADPLKSTSDLEVDKIVPHYVLPQNYSATAAQAAKTAREMAVRVAESIKHEPALRSGPGFSFRRLSTARAVDEDDDGHEMDVSQGPRHSSAAIDKPFNSSYKSAGESSPKSSLETSGEGIFSESDDTPTDAGPTSAPSLEQIYTRCCHLREILPLPAALIQIKGKECPLTSLQLMNPRPTLIEVLAFADFLAVAPVTTVLLDNCTLTHEMLAAIFTSLASSRFLNRLSLRNVLLDSQAWRMFCAFLATTPALDKLDISIQADDNTGMYGCRKLVRSRRLVKLKSDTDRSELDWKLFVAALEFRGGIEELVVNGCMVPSEDLDELILKACCMRTKRLGLASNDLGVQEFKSLRTWLRNPNVEAQGLDLADNDISSYWDEEEDGHRVMDAPYMRFLSLNSAQISNVHLATTLMSKLALESQLQYLDFSGNENLFPDFTTKLRRFLVQFQDLRRLHLDDNDLSSSDVVELSEAFASCKSLVHISLLGNRRLDGTAGAALAACVDISSTIYQVQVDQDLFSESLLRRLSHMCIVNLEAMMSGGKMASKGVTLDEISPDHEHLATSGMELAKALADISGSSYHADQTRVDSVLETIRARSRDLRGLLQTAMDQLFAKRRQNPEGLTTDEKDRLVKLLYVDSTLERVLAQSKDQAPPDPVVHAVQESIEPVGPSLSRTSSSTSLRLKRQELEEGEFHRLGAFVLSKKHELPPDLELEPPTASGAHMRKVILDAKGDSPMLHVIQGIKKLDGQELEKIILENRRLPFIFDEHTDELDQVIDGLEQVRSH